MKSCPISLQETDSPVRLTPPTGSYVTPAPGSDSVLDKQPEPAGRRSPLGWPEATRRPHAEIWGPAHITCVLDPAGLDDDGTTQVRELTCSRFCLSWFLLLPPAGRSHN